jgi:tyrosinase
MEQYASYERITGLLQNSANVVAFHSQLEAPDGLHVNPHSYIGGLQNNIYLSSQDPWFFIHHCMIDRVWAIWQSLDFNTRTMALDPFTNFESRQRLDCKLPCRRGKSPH